MTLFDKLVTEALQNLPELSPLRIVVEKELLHHDILRTLSNSNLLPSLTFIGGTCLRSCYGNIRLSEDLDFTGGNDFTRESLSEMSKVLIDSINKKYDFLVKISEPVKDKNNVDTWKIKIETRPDNKFSPIQRINIDICAVPSYEKIPMMLLNPYGVDMGTSGLIIQAQSREEIYADKLLAFALRLNRIKYRDLWDIVWLHQQGLKPRFELISKKLDDRKCEMDYFLNLFKDRSNLMKKDTRLELEFNKEMERFLPKNQIKEVVEKNNLWNFIVYLISDLYSQIARIK
jgi:predicted nucleotidyltransferase component of viral defense system